MNVQSTTEQIREAQHIVNLVRIIRPPRCHNRILANGVGFFRCNLRIRVRHGENHRIGGHASDHIGRHSTLNRHTDKHVSVIHRLVQSSGFSVGCVRRLPLVHPLGSALINHALGIANKTVVMLGTHGFHQLHTSNSRSTRAVNHNPAVLDFLAGDMQRIDQPRRTDHGRAVLVVVEDRDVHLFLKALFDDETFRRLDVLKVNAAKTWPHQANGVNDFIGVLGVQLDVYGINVCETFEQNRLTLHHGLGRQRPQISHPQNGRTIRNYRYQITLGGVVIRKRRIVRDRLNGRRNTGRICQRQIPLRGHRGRGVNLDFPGRRFTVIGKRLFVGDFGTVGHVSAFGLKIS